MNHEWAAYAAITAPVWIPVLLCVVRIAFILLGWAKPEGEDIGDLM